MTAVTETPTLLDFETVLARVEAVVAERPDYVNAVPATKGYSEYKTCFYFNPDGSPSCIVGQALASELAAAGVRHGRSSNTHGVLQLLARDVTIPLTEKAVRFLWRLQSQQDLGATWGDALAYAKRDLAQNEHLDDTEPADSPYRALTTAPS